MNKPLSIRYATLSDWKIILTIEQSSLNRFYSTGTKKEDITKYLKNEKILLAFINEKAVGKISYIEKVKEVRISGLVILKKWRGNEYGYVLSKYILEKFPKVNKFSLVVHPENIHAKNIYTKLGFRPKTTIDNYFGDGEPRQLMEYHK